MRAKGIDIAFPQQDLHLRSVPEGCGAGSVPFRANRSRAQACALDPSPIDYRGKCGFTRDPQLCNRLYEEKHMLTKNIWAAGLSAAVIGMMGAPAGALPG